MRGDPKIPFYLQETLLNNVIEVGKMVHRQNTSTEAGCRPARRWLLTALLALIPTVTWICGPLMAADEKAKPKGTDAKVTASKEKDTDNKTTEKKTTKKKATKKPLTAAERAKLKAEARVNALARKFNMRLGKLRPADSRLRTLDDYYITCTAQLNQATRQVDICFQVRQGQQDVADFLADYMLNPPEKTLRNWHVIARFSNPEAAEVAVEATRSQYDQMVAYRTQLEKQYRAKKSRRC
jgi:hypothetical protein